MLIMLLALDRAVIHLLSCYSASGAMVNPFNVLFQGLLRAALYLTDRNRGAVLPKFSVIGIQAARFLFISNR